MTPLPPDLERYHVQREHFAQALARLENGIRALRELAVHLRDRE